MPKRHNDVQTIRPVDRRQQVDVFTMENRCKNADNSIGDNAANNVPTKQTLVY